MISGHHQQRKWRFPTQLLEIKDFEDLTVDGHGAELIGHNMSTMFISADAKTS